MFYSDIRNVIVAGFKAAVPAIAIAGALALGGTAQAAHTYVVDRGDMPYNRILNISGLGNVWGGPIFFDGTVDGTPFIDLVAFCVDIYHHIGLNDYAPDLVFTDENELTYDSNPGGQALHWSGPSGLSAGDLHTIGRLANFGDLVAHDGSLLVDQKKDKLAATQGAIWQVVSGRNVTGAGLDALIDQYSSGNLGAHNYGVISSHFTFITPEAYPATSGQQSFIFASVPEPGTWALMIGGFGLAGAMLRRRRLTAVRA